MLREEAPAIIESAAVPTSGAPATNRLAVASMVLGITGFTVLPLIGSLLGIIFGHISSGQIKGSDGTQKGRGMAITGLILGYGVVVALIALIAFFIISLKVSEDCGGFVARRC